MIGLNLEHGVLAGAVAILAWVSHGFVNAFRMGGRLAKIETTLSGLDAKFDRLEDRVNRHLDKE